MVASKELEIAGRIGDQMADEAQDDKAKKRGGRYVQHAFPGGPTVRKVPGAMFGPKPFRLPDGLSTAKAPGPRGGAPADDIEWAKKRRAQRAEEERNHGLTQR
jgi:hypothetical protein